MARPGSFFAGSAFGALFAGLLVAGLPTGHADETRRDVRLVVSCDEATRPKLLAALRPLQVAVYDLATMERIPLQAPVPLIDAFAVWKAVDQAVVQARENGPRGATLAVLKIAVTSQEVNVGVHVNDVAILDALQDRLQKSAELGVARVERGPVQKDASGQFDSAFRLVAAADARRSPEAASKSIESFPLAAVRDALQARGAELRMVSAETRTVGTNGEATSTTSLDCGVPDVGSLKAVFEGLSAVPGLRVTALSWRLTPKDGRVRAQIEVTAFLQK